MRKATEELEYEHRIIERVVAAMAVLAEKLQSGKKIRATVWPDLVEFLHIFADTCHHGKEEGYLFLLLEKKGVPVSGCPLAVLLNDHRKGQSLVADLRQTSEAYLRAPDTDKEALIGTLHRLVELYPAHIWKEDYLLFPMTNKILSDGEQEALSQPPIGIRGSSEVSTQRTTRHNLLRQLFDTVVNIKTDWRFMLFESHVEEDEAIR